mgnify:CR=1 FL=1
MKTFSSIVLTGASSGIGAALAALKLFSPDVKVRRQAALSLLKEPDASRAPLLEKALAAEKDPAVQSLVRQARAAALAEAVRALPEEIVHYKSLRPLRPSLLAWLDHVRGG